MTRPDSRIALAISGLDVPSDQGDFIIPSIPERVVEAAPALTFAVIRWWTGRRRPPPGRPASCSPLPAERSCWFRPRPSSISIRVPLLKPSARGGLTRTVSESRNADGFLHQTTGRSSLNVLHRHAEKSRTPKIRYFLGAIMLRQCNTTQYETQGKMAARHANAR